jgi:hypothetical protein
MERWKRAFLEKIRRPPQEADALKLSRRFDRHGAPTYFRFLDEPGVEPTNIGADADESMLAQFLGDQSKKVFHAEDASKIKGFFKFVTMSRVRATWPLWSLCGPIGDGIRDPASR